METGCNHIRSGFFIYVIWFLCLRWDRTAQVFFQSQRRDKDQEAKGWSVEGWIRVFLCSCVFSFCLCLFTFIMLACSLCLWLYVRIVVSSLYFSFYGIYGRSIKGCLRSLLIMIIITIIIIMYVTIHYSYACFQHIYIYIYIHNIYTHVCLCTNLHIWNAYGQFS